jgi:hypothetical protein
MPEITEDAVRDVARIAGAASYGYNQVHVERRGQYEWEDPEVPIYCLGRGTGSQTWKNPREAVAFLLGCIRAGREERDDFHLTEQDQAIVDTVAAEIPGDDRELQFWEKYGRTNTVGSIHGVQEGRLRDFTLWDAKEVAAHLSIDPDSVRRQLSRWGIQRADTGESESGRMTALYSAAKVRAAHAARPGRGARTDLSEN